MAVGYLKRLDVGYPTRSNPRGIYAVKMLEHEDLAVLEGLVNIYLLKLPGASGGWTPHIASIEYDNYTTPPPMPTLHHVCTVTIFAAGTIDAPPIG